jgi:tetratricopeptide (TPR) repeat protein
MPEFNYDAFISYRRSDGIAVARWLRRELVGFRPPKSLRGTYGRKLRIYLDTAYERGTSDFYEQNIRPALMSSRFLIVVATPDAMPRPGGGEDWIEREIRDFTAGPSGSNVIAVRGAGEFDGPLPANLKQSFPNIEIIDMRGASRFWFLSFSRVVRLASEKLKLVAPLLGVPPEEMPKLRQEEEKRQQTRLGGIVGATLGILVAVTSLSVFALISRYQAIRAHDDSMFAAGSMAEQARALGTSDPDTERIRRLIISRGCDLLDKAERETASDPPITGIVLCRLERGTQRESMKEDKEARKQFGEAIELADQAHQRRSRIDAALALLQARQAYAEYLTRGKDAAGSEAEYAKLLEDARRLGKEHDRSGQFARYEGEALGQIGDRQIARGDRAAAADNFDAAAVAVTKSLDMISELRNAEPRTVEWIMRLHRLAGQQYVYLGKFDPALERFNRALAARSLGGTEQVTPSIEFETAVVHASTFALEIKRGNPDAAATARQNALASIDLVAKSENSTARLKQRAADLKSWTENQGEH